MKISVITVTYNCSEVLNDCITSVKNQSYKNIEHLVIDGGSSNDTMKLLRANQHHFTVLVSEPDYGIYDAMNKGIKLAKGDVIGFLNSDDFYNNNDVLLKVANLFKSDANLNACYADLVYTDKVNTSKIIRYWKPGEFIFGSFSKGWSPPHPTLFVRKSIYERIGCFNLKYKISSDVDLMMRLLEVHKIRVRYIPELWIRMRLGGLSNKNFKNILKQNLDVLRALKSNNLIANPFSFFIHKIYLRAKQFLKI
ncbi:glycosyltransferase family 2 protein [Candidatus Pelagibacter sp.]|nr:glycosyltransferase family 2 protein [Candidatus Pelagibacter sp.]